MGKLVLVVGQTGSGKGTLIAHLREVMPELVFPVSCTTRPMRPGEVPGRDYYFITDEEFQARVERDEFLEWVHTDQKRYGTLKAEILVPLAEGKDVLREVDVKGVAKVRGLLPPGVVKTIYIDAGGWEDLEPRILSRAPLSAEELVSRRARFEAERPFKDEADCVVTNLTGGVEQAKKDIVAAVRLLVAA